jgi:protein-S-isoprenylcysteine O-methyltransferase Ste14
MFAPMIDSPMHTQSARFLELRIPPVVLVILVAILMWAGAAQLPQFDFQVPFQLFVGWIMVLGGIVVCALGVFEFKRAKTTVNPTKPQSSSALVKSGIYRRTRNPMYLGFLFILMGSAILTANLVALLALPAFVLYMNQFQIKPEERALTTIFGNEFRAYCSSVRRWI